MSKRVYEIAQELKLSTKEVLDRLNEEGMEVKSPLASVEDHLYERVIGGDPGDATHNGLLERKDLEILPKSSLEPQRRRSRIRWVLMLYVLIAIFTFAVAAGIGAIAALVVQGEIGWPAGDRAGQEKPSPASEQGNTADRPQQQKAGAERKQAASQQEETTYVDRVGEIQTSAVETFLDSNDKLQHYDALTADDVKELQANQASLQELTHEAEDLNPPPNYEDQYKVFRLAVSELHEVTQLAYTFAADPTAATQSGFDEYDRHVTQAAAYLKKSNEMLGRDYKTIEGVQKVSPLS